MIAEAGPSYDDHWNQLAALIATTAMDANARAEIVVLMDLLYTIRLVHLEAEKVIRDAAGLTIAKAPEIVRGVQRTRGGKSAGKKKKDTAKALHENWISSANKMIRSGTSHREVSGELAKRFDVTARAIRTALQEGGVLPAKKRK